MQYLSEMTKSKLWLCILGHQWDYFHHEKRQSCSN
jgi:hypothetical protein